MFNLVAASCETMPTVPEIMARGINEPPITMLTAYDKSIAEIADSAGIDIVLVGDSVGNTVLGYETTLPVTIEEMISHTAAVVRGVKEALVVTDLPFLSVGVDESVTIMNAGKMLKMGGADAVKIESGPHTISITKRLVDLGIPVMAHVGLLPQRIRQIGGYYQQGTDESSALEIMELARGHENAGAFAIVLEHMPSDIAKNITEKLDIPTIGIGAGPHTRGQVLVVDDVIGLSNSLPPFARKFGDVRTEMSNAIKKYREEVISRKFPPEDTN